MHRKLTMVFCAAVLSLGLSACGGGGGKTAAPPAPDPDPVMAMEAVDAAEAAVMALTAMSSDAAVMAADAAIEAAETAVAGAAGLSDNDASALRERIAAASAGLDTARMEIADYREHGTQHAMAMAAVDAAAMAVMALTAMSSDDEVMAAMDLIDAARMAVAAGTMLTAAETDALDDRIADAAVALAAAEMEMAEYRKGVPDPSMLGELRTIEPAGGYPAVPPEGRHLVTDVAAAQAHAGGMPLELSRGRYTYGGNRIVSSGNTLIVGPRVASWNRRLPEFTCVGEVCSTNPPETPYNVYSGILITHPKTAMPVLEKNGIALLQRAVTWTYDIQDYTGSGDYDFLMLMSDAAVAQTFYENGESMEKATGILGQYAVYEHHVGGLVEGTAPPGDATYRGLMVGSVVEKDDTVELNVPDWVVGDVTLTFDLAALELGATFSGIVGLTSGQTFDDLEWTGISVSGGAFKQVVAASENYIEGAFFGANREGAAGVFEQNAIYGSFAAMDPASGSEQGLTDVERHTLEDLARARRAAGGETPDFTVEEYAAAGTEVFREADIFLAGDRIAGWEPDRTRRAFECTGRVCAYDDGYETFTDDLSIGHTPIDPDIHEAVMRKNGIGVVQFAVGFEWGEGADSGYNIRYGLGLWGEENVAWTYFDLGYDNGYYGSRTAGAASGSNPSGSATWTGAMAGSMVEKDRAVALNRPEWVMGDAELTFDLAEAALGASFTNIVSLATDKPHADLRWDGVPVMDGAFDDGPVGNYLRGSFFGAAHEGVAGVFEHNSIAGAFSAAQ